LGGSICLQALELLERALEVSLGGVDAVLEAGEDFSFLIVDGAAEENEVFLTVGFLAVFGTADFDIAVPELGFGATEAAENPVGVDEDIDEAALVGNIGLKTVGVAGGEGLEVDGIFALNDFGFGIDAGGEGIQPGNGFAGVRRGAGGFLGIATTSFVLKLGTHGAS
jgi:hypothetical protein